MDKRVLQLGRVIEYDKCYQILDIPRLSPQILRMLNNYECEIRENRDSLTGFELVVAKNATHPSVYWWIGSALALAVAATWSNPFTL